MNTTLTYIFGNATFKWVYSIYTILGTVSVAEQAKMSNSSFLDALLDSMPTKVLYIFGLIYFSLFILTRVSKFIKQVVLDKEDIKQKRIQTKHQENAEGVYLDKNKKSNSE